jgi:LemA protein
MKKGSMVLLSIAAVLVLILFWGIGTNNSLVRLHEDVNLKFGQIQTTLQRRSDLIPNLVATVKGYAAHEEKVFTEIAESRSKLSGAISSGDINAIKEANDGLSAALGRLLAIQEAYPELKANENFTALMDELAGTENRINVARQDYNETVARYNMKIKVFPSNIIANMNGFTAEKYFEADEGAQKVPTVDFNN